MPLKKKNQIWNIVGAKREEKWLPVREVRIYHKNLRTNNEKEQRFHTLTFRAVNLFPGESLFVKRKNWHKTCWCLTLIMY